MTLTKVIKMEMRTRRKKTQKKTYINEWKTSPTLLYQHNDTIKNINIITND
jgi:hypothetical protein